MKIMTFNTQHCKNYVEGHVDFEIMANAIKTCAPDIVGLNEMFEVSDIYKTSVCPLAKVMRTRLKKEGIKKLKVVYSKETPLKTNVENGKPIPASISFVPSVAGLIIAGEVIKDLIKA